MIKDYYKLCPGCFTDRGDRTVCPNCGFKEENVQSSLALSAHTLLHDQYLVGKVLGKPGGFGITYFGWDTKLETTLAIKEYLPREFASRGKDGTTVTPHSDEDSKTFEYGLKQFLQEARNLAKFDHPNLVRVRHFFEENETAYLVMDYLEGCNLFEHAKQKGGKLSEDEAIKIMLQVLDGLQHVHKSNLLHRDIKPQNIYMTKDGRAILLDFGAARTAMGGFTRSMSVVLTPGFAPYEQYHRRGLQGPWTDIYACAATLYYLITGEALPEATEGVHEKRSPLLLAHKTSQITLGLHSVLESALAVEPEARPQSVAEFRELLLKAKSTTSSDEKATVIIKDKTVDKPKKESGKKKTAVYVTGAALVLLLVAVGVFYWSKSKSTAVTQADSQPESQTASQPGSQPVSEAGNLQASLEPVVKNDRLPEKPDLYQVNRTQGDSLFGVEKYDAALTAYKNALSLKADDKYSADQIKLIEKKIKERGLEEEQKAFEQTKDEADKLFKQGKSAQALKKYKSALKFKPKDDYLANQARICSEMVFVPGGKFLMGKEGAAEKPLHKVSLNAFYMDKYEVTVSEYEMFLKAKNYTIPLKWGEQLKNPKSPVVYVSWEDANAYAKWAGKRLPTEAEWECAARGGLEQKTYPWGDDPPESRPEFPKRFTSDLRGKARDVGMFKPNGYGIHDMADNVWEWCADWFAFDYYAQSSDTNPTGPKSGDRKVVRGIVGSDAFSAYNFRCDARFAQEPGTKKDFIGFRCVLDIK